MNNYKCSLAEDIQMGDIIVTDHGVHIGPITQIDIDCHKNWVSVSAENGDGYACNADEYVTVMRKPLKD